MLKPIKAYRCYVCGRLYPIKSRGFTIAKQYAEPWRDEKDRRDLCFCSDCTEKMMFWAMKHRGKTIEEIVEEGESK